MFTREYARDDAGVREHLEVLYEARRAGAPLLNRLQVRSLDTVCSMKCRYEDIRRRDGILYREINTNSADRGHRMRRIPDTQEPG